jgi:hypothetical protein
MGHLEICDRSQKGQANSQDRPSEVYVPNEINAASETNETSEIDKALRAGPRKALRHCGLNKLEAGAASCLRGYLAGAA